MTDGETCGHEKNDGEPCTFEPKYPDGKCGHHTEHDTGAERREGRPSKLSYERQEKIATAVEAGKSITSAARMAGVDRTTVYGWLDKGEAAKQAGEENEFAEFYDRLTRAKGHGEDFYFGLALELAKENEDHRFIASLMKQRYPDSWGETETGVESVEINVTSDVVEVTEDDLQH
jgi:transposase-like protein